MNERVIIARTAKRDHANGADGQWWTEYAVRQLTEQEINNVWQSTSKVYHYVLESRYCHDVDSEYCSGHTGQWQHWDYGQTEQLAVQSCDGDTMYQDAESLSPLHIAMKEQVAKDKAKNARIAELREVIYYTWRDRWGLHTKEINIERDEKEKAQAEFEQECKKARIWSKALAGTAPEEKIAELKARVMANYHARLKIRQEEHERARQELQELEVV